MILLLHTHFSEKLDAENLRRYLELLPAEFRARARRFHQWRDAQAFVFGKMLLLDGLQRCGLDGLRLDDLSYTQFHRPYFDTSVDFNISHSGNVVICALNTHGKVGVDVELIRAIKLDDFAPFFHDEEMFHVKSAPSSIAAFYDLWTKKEAVIKADGKGLNIPLKSVRISPDNKAFVDGNHWHIMPVDLYNDYCIHLATSASAEDVKVECLHYN